MRLLDVATDRLWLIFDGRRHHVTSIDVHTSLFRQSVSLTRVDGAQIAQVREGQELIYGSRLVRTERRPTIYFVAVFPTTVVLHPIPNTAVFDKYGFDYTLCQTLPETLFGKMSQGRALS